MIRNKIVVYMYIYAVCLVKQNKTDFPIDFVVSGRRFGKKLKQMKPRREKNKQKDLQLHYRYMNGEG